MSTLTLLLNTVSEALAREIRQEMEMKAILIRKEINEFMFAENTILWCMCMCLFEVTSVMSNPL